MPGSGAPAAHTPPRHRLGAADRLVDGGLGHAVRVVHRRFAAPHDEVTRRRSASPPSATTSRSSSATPGRSSAHTRRRAHVLARGAQRASQVLQQLRARHDAECRAGGEAEKTSPMHGSHVCAEQTARTARTDGVRLDLARRGASAPCRPPPPWAPVEPLVDEVDEGVRRRRAAAARRRPRRWPRARAAASRVRASRRARRSSRRCTAATRRRRRRGASAGAPPATPGRAAPQHRPPARFRAAPAQSQGPRRRNPRHARQQRSPRG